MIGSMDRASSREFDRARWNQRLEEIAWGLFLLMLGVLWMLPDQRVPEHVWLLCAGATLLGLNAARLLSGIPMNSFSTILGSVAVGVWLASWLGVDVPLLAILLVLFGLYIIVGPFLRRELPKS